MTTQPGLRILFVDDEPLILKTLRRGLAQDPGLTVACAGDGEQGLSLLATDRFDVVVSDFKMPVLDGVGFLGRVKQEWPDVVRLLLTGSGPEPTKRTDVVAHQLLTKPVAFDRLRETCERINLVRGLLEDPEQRASTGGIASLPSVPEALLELNAVLTDRWASAKQIAAVIAGDAAMSAKILQLVNSAFFRMSSRDTSNLDQAVVHLGVSTISAIATSLAILRAFDGAGRLPGFDISALQARATSTAQLARQMFREPERQDDAFAGGLLMSVGQLVIATEMPEYFGDVLATSATGGAALHEIEREKRGVTHAAVGAYLLGIWGLRTQVVEAVAHQFEPRPARGRVLNVVDAVHIAARLMEAARRNAETGEQTAEELDPDWLAALGVTASLAKWRETAEELVAQGG